MLTKTQYEEILYRRDFRRSDGRGWLGRDETITSAVVAVRDGAGQEHADMVANVAVHDGVSVVFLLRGGRSGGVYTVSVRVTTDKGQKFEDMLTLTVSGGGA
ncbi:MAG: hypothetical protein GYA56_13695 [Geobacteraceae bacterium]|nr:hypothetical protein [Geobacteraceae bacterium]